MTLLFRDIFTDLGIAHVFSAVSAVQANRKSSEEEIVDLSKMYVQSVQSGRIEPFLNLIVILFLINYPVKYKICIIDIIFVCQVVIIRSAGRLIFVITISHG